MCIPCTSLYGKENPGKKHSVFIQLSAIFFVGYFSKGISPSGKFPRVFTQMAISQAASYKVCPRRSTWTLLQHAALQKA